MNALGQQMALARGGIAAAAASAWRWRRPATSRPATRSSPFSVWGSALGGFGAVLGDSNASTLTYNFGGVAAGIDYRLDPRFLVGLGVGYTHGTQWVNGFQGQGWTDNVSVAAYGSFTQGAFYADMLAGYAYFNNQLQRQIADPRPAAAHGPGQDRRQPVPGPGRDRLQVPALCAGRRERHAVRAAAGVSSVNQNAFTESGRQLAQPERAQQTTNSLRTLFGADLAGNIALGNRRTLDLGGPPGLAARVCLHGPADHGCVRRARRRPRSPSTAPRRSAMPPSSASRPAPRVAEQAQLYLRYDGEIGSGTDNHAFNLGVRINW